MQATARRLSVVSATSCARRRLIRSVRPTNTSPVELTPLSQLIQKRGGALRPPAPKTFPDYTIPQEYELFLLDHDGSDGMDEAGWEFWGRSGLQSIPSVTDASVHSMPSDCHDPENYIIFADHLIYAGFLCFRIHRPTADTPLFYFFGFGALYPLAHDWFDLHYAIEFEDHESPCFDSLRQRCLAGTTMKPTPQPGVF